MYITISTVGYIDYILQGLTAIGTVGAVIVSLYFSSIRNKISAEGYINFGLMGDPTQNPKEILMIEIINSGIKPFKITGFYIRSKKLKLNFVFFPDDTEPHSTPHGFIYEESSSGQYIYPKTQFIENLPQIFAGNTNDKTNLSIPKKIKSLEFYAKTNLDREIKLKPRYDLLKECIQSHL